MTTWQLIKEGAQALHGQSVHVVFALWTALGIDGHLRTEPRESAAAT